MATLSNSQNLLNTFVIATEREELFFDVKRKANSFRERLKLELATKVNALVKTPEAIFGERFSVVVWSDSGANGQMVVATALKIAAEMGIKISFPQKTENDDRGIPTTC